MTTVGGIAAGCSPTVADGTMFGSANGIDPTIFPLQIQPQLNNILNNPGRLDYFEPKTTFRFTVSRTF